MNTFLAGSVRTVCLGVQEQSATRPRRYKCEIISPQGGRTASMPGPTCQLSCVASHVRWPQSTGTARPRCRSTSSLKEAACALYTEPPTHRVRLEACTGCCRPAPWSVSPSPEPCSRLSLGWGLRAQCAQAAPNPLPRRKDAGTDKSWLKTQVRATSLSCLAQSPCLVAASLSRCRPRRRRPRPSQSLLSRPGR